MEVLTIFYALLAALTGFSVGESTPQRTAEVGCTAATLVSDVIAAETQQRERAARLVPPVAVASVPPILSLLPVATDAAPPAVIAWIDLARRHL